MLSKSYEDDYIKINEVISRNTMLSLVYNTILLFEDAYIKIGKVIRINTVLLPV